MFQNQKARVMGTNTIQIGIDLGTTNSAVAVRKEGDIRIVRNNWNDEITPSVFGFNANGQKEVGRRAYEKLFRDPTEEHVANFVSEVKRVMGEEETVYFPRKEVELKPEEISAEILKKLKKDVHRNFPNLEPTAAVITIPAHFSTLQSEATYRAGKEAGFDHVVLLQEPIAAALQYGYSQEKDGNWLVYDLGGGTFDTALISSTGGTLSVQEHHGDRHLGGKDFDRKIVREEIKPKLKKKRNVDDLSTVTDQKFRYYAERCKKFLSNHDSTSEQISINEEEYGSVQFELSKDRFEDLIEPELERTVNLTEKTIESSGLDAKSIDRIILVGGSTRIPRVQERLEEAFNIPVDTSVDQVTVVARGACIYGAGREIPEEYQAKPEFDQKEDIYPVELNYDSLTSQEEEPITGWIEGLPQDKSYFLDIKSESGHYSNSNIKVKDGKFYDSVALEPRTENTFHMQLLNESGESVPIEPKTFSIQHGLDVSSAPLPHSIGVAVLDKVSDTEKMVFYFEKNDELPLEGQKTFRTSRNLKQGDSSNVLPVKVYEGESDRPERNSYICAVEITGEDVPHDLPEDTEVELTIEVSESREVEVNAYIPDIDEWFNVRETIYDEAVSVSELREELNQLKQERKELLKFGTFQEKREVRQIMKEVEELLKGEEKASDDDRRKARQRLKEVNIKLDELDEKTRQERLEKEFHSYCKNLEEILQEVEEEISIDQHQQDFNGLKTDGESAIESEDLKKLSRINDRLDQLMMNILTDTPSTWAVWFRELKSGKYRFKNREEANRLFQRGEKAIKLGNFEELTYCVQELFSLLPEEEQKQVKLKSGIKL